MAPATRVVGRDASSPVADEIAAGSLRLLLLLVACLSSSAAAPFLWPLTGRRRRHRKLMPLSLPAMQRQRQRRRLLGEKSRELRSQTNVPSDSIFSLFLVSVA